MKNMKGRKAGKEELENERMCCIAQINDMKSELCRLQKNKQNLECRIKELSVRLGQMDAGRRK